MNNGEIAAESCLKGTGWRGGGSSLRRER